MESPLISTAPMERAAEAMVASKLAIMRGAAEVAHDELGRWLASRIEGLPADAYTLIRNAHKSLTAGLRNSK